MGRQQAAVSDVVGACCRADGPSPYERGFVAVAALRLVARSLATTDPGVRRTRVQVECLTVMVRLTKLLTGHDNAPVAVSVATVLAMTLIIVGIVLLVVDRQSLGAAQAFLYPGIILNLIVQLWLNRWRRRQVKADS